MIDSTIRNGPVVRDAGRRGGSPPRLPAPYSPPRSYLSPRSSPTHQLLADLREQQFRRFVTVAYADHYLDLVAGAIRSGLNEQLAMDAVQDAFLSVIELKDHILTSRPPGIDRAKFLRLLYRAVPQYVTIYRAEGKREILLSADALLNFHDGISSVTPSPEQVVEENESEQRIFAAIGRLPAQQRRAIGLQLAGLRRSEIAQTMKITDRKVVHLLYLARKTLAERLEYRQSGNFPARTARPQPLPPQTLMDFGLEQLPPRQRQVMTLSLNGLPPREIAELLGIKPGAVRVNLHLARRKLKMSAAGAPAGIDGMVGRRWLEEQWLAVLEQRLDADLVLGRHAELVAELTELVAERPMHEGLRRRLMLALAATGRQAEALAVFREGRRVVVDEFGAEPGPDLRAMHGAILAGEIVIVDGTVPGRQATASSGLPGCGR
jgi:RNA polymerase sigma factor (sigma-70 family)